MRIILLLLFSFVITKNLNGQEFTVQNFTDDNGLPQNSVKSIAKDNAGFIWLATENGLVRFDGQKFILFDKNQTKARSNRFITLKKDVSNDKLYGLTENWKLVEIKDGKVSPTPISFQTVFNFENSTFNTHFFAAGVPNGVESYVKKENPYIIEKKNGYTYKILNGIISLYKQRKLVNQTKFNYKSLWNFFLLDDALYHIDEKLKLTKFEKNKITEVKLLGKLADKIGKSRGKLFWNINTNNVFINIENSLYALNRDLKSGQISSENILKNVNLDEIGVRSIYRNNDNGEIYIGTSTKGLFIYKAKQFNTLVSEDNFENNVFYAQIPFEESSVLFTSGHIFKKANNTNRLKTFNNYSGRYTLAIDINKNVWTAKDNNIYQLSPDLKTVNRKFNFPYNVNTINIDDDETVYAGSIKGVYLLKKGEKSFSQLALLKETDSISYLKKTKNILWVGTNSGLLYYDFVKEKIHIIKELENKQIRSIYVRNKEIWVTTYGDGFYLFINGKLTRLPNDKNKYLNTAHCILEDNNGFFWISTNKGLFKAKISDLLAYSTKETNTVYYSYFDRSAGFNTNEFNGGCQPCGTILNDGDFTFPSMNGITLFNPSTLISSIPDKPIYIDNITLDNKVLSSNKEELEIPNNFIRLTFNLSTPYFGNKEDLNFEYKLANQEIWTQSTDQLISFSFLPTGKNTLNIRKVNGFGVNNYSYKNIVLFVQPYFYQTWWFITFSIISFVLIIFFYIKLRTKRIRNRNLQLEKSIYESTLELQSTIKAYEFSKNRLDHQTYFQSRLISAITHDIKSPLKYLMMTGEALYESKSNEVDRDGLKAIFTSSSQIYHFTENLVQYAKGFTTKDLEIKQTFNLYNLIEEKIAIFKPIAKNQHTWIINDINLDIIITTNKHLLSVIIHNLLDNAVKFTTNGKITLAFIKIELGYKIIINDTGHGMNSYQVDWCNSNDDSLDQTISIEKNPSPAGLGLIMVKEINKIIKGKLFVCAIEGKGATFEITLAD